MCPAPSIARGDPREEAYGIRLLRLILVGALVASPLAPAALAYPITESAHHRVARHHRHHRCRTRRCGRLWWEHHRPRCVWISVGATLDPTAGQAPTWSDHGGFSFAELLEA